MLQAGQDLDNRYRIDAHIGQGGMGVVYRATDLNGGQTVAVKVLLLPEDESTIRFRREFRVMSRLEHPNVVQVVGFGASDGKAYLAMEYVDGGTLTNAFAQPPETVEALAERLDLLAGVADALAYVHAEGVIHRDLKPENVLLKDGRPVLMDFGLAKAASGETMALTQVGDVLGTAAYMSPEQIRGRNVDHRSDLYALGCLIQWSATGRPPFEGETFTDVVIKHLTQSSSAPSAYLGLVPAKLDGLVATLLAKEPSDRFASASDVATRLRAIASSLRGDEVGAEVGARKDAESDEGARAGSSDASSASTSSTGRYDERSDTTPANLLRPPLIGRDELWRTLVEVLNPGSETKPILLETEVGMGGSRLLGDLSGEAELRNVRVVWVAAQKGVNVAYEGWSRALDRLRRRDAAGFAKAAAGLEDALALVVPQIFPDATPLNLPADVAQLRLYEAVDVFFRRLLEGQPLLLLFDDLQDADEGTVLLLRHLARGVVREGAAMIATFRSDDAPRATRDAVRHLEARRIELEPLTPEATRELVRGFLGGDVDPQLERHVARRSGGNPYFVHELLEALLAGGHISRRAESWVWSRAVAELPSSIESVFDQRIEALEERPRSVARAAATIGPVAPFELLQRLVKADEDDLLDDLDELVRAGVMREQRGDRYAFEHPLLRETLHDSLSARRRRRFHARLAELLEEDGDATPDVLAQHFAEAENAAEASRYAMEAAHAAERVFANDVAERFYRLVLTVNEDAESEAVEPAVVSRARLALARVLDLTGRWDEAEDLFEFACGIEATRLDALRAYARFLRLRGRLAAGEQAALAALDLDANDVSTWRELGSIRILRSDFDGAREALHTALGGLIENENADPREIALTYAELGYLEMTINAYDDASEWYASAHSVVDASEDPLLAGRIDQQVGLLNYHQGNLNVAERHFTSSYDAYQSAGDVAQALLAKYNLGMVLEERGALSEATEVFGEVRDSAYRVGDQRNEASAAATWGWTLQRQGRFDEAVEKLRHAFAYFASQGFESTRRQVHLNLITTLVRAGNTQRARESWGGYLALREEDGLKPYEVPVERMTEGELDLRSGMHRAALPVLQEAEAAFEEMGAVQERIEVALLVAEAHLALGDNEACLATVRKVAELAKTFPDTSWSLKLDFVEAVAEGRDADIAALAGDMEEAYLQSYEQQVQRMAEFGRRRGSA